MGKPAEPFLKWAGGKRGLSSSIIQYFSHLSHESTYFEPFLGGGAMFFALNPKRAILSDINADLIDTYIAVRDRVGEIIDELSQLPYSSDAYYEIRSWRPTTEVEKAARFIYLNKTCFNGLYRVNQRGEFNVPFGRHGPNLVICDSSQLIAASEALADTDLLCLDFEQALESAGEGDFVYCDPPYTSAHTNNGFIEYNAGVFSWDDQHRLALVASQLVDKEANVVVSNADHVSILQCFLRYGKFEAKPVKRWSTIAGRSSKRFPTTELVFVNREI
jgi:DNA adenine methylase